MFPIAVLLRRTLIPQKYFRHFLKKPVPSVYAHSPFTQVDKSEEPFSWATPDIDGLRALCQRVLGWDRVQSDGLLMPMIKVRSETSRSRSWLLCLL